MFDIFYVIELLESFNMKEDIIFILTARLPEYDDLVSKRLFELDEQERTALRKFNETANVKYHLPYFTVEEIERFFAFYKTKCNIEKWTTKSYLDIFKETNGYPIMVKFFLLGKGLRDDVEDRYRRYLYNSEIKPPKPIAENIQTMIICALFSISNQTITDKTLEDLKIGETGIKKFASNISGILHKKQDGTWYTIHSRWDMEFFSFLFYPSPTSLEEADDQIDDETKINLKIACNTIFGMQNKEFSRSVISVLYNMAGQRRIPIGILNDDNVLVIPDYITNDPDAMCSIHAHDKGNAYYYLKRYDDMLGECEKAIGINSHYTGALRSKGLALYRLGDYKNAILWLNEALAIDERDIDALNDLGWAQYHLGNYDEAKVTLDKALKINPNYVLAIDNRSDVSFQLDRIDEAIQFADKAVEIDSSYAPAWYDRARYRVRKGEIDEAMKDLEESIKIDSTNINRAKTDKDFDSVRNNERFSKLNRNK